MSDAMFMNNCEIAGVVCRCKRLPEGFEMKYTSNGSAMLKINLLYKDMWQDKDTHEDKCKSTYFDLVVWGKQAEDYAKLLSVDATIKVKAKYSKRTVEKEGRTTGVYPEFVVRELVVTGKDVRQAPQGQPQQSQNPPPRSPAPAPQAPAQRAPAPAPRPQAPSRPAAPQRQAPPPPPPLAEENNGIPDDDIPF